MANEKEVFNHKYKTLHDAIGLEKSRADELREMAKAEVRRAAKNKDTSKSHGFERLLSNGMNVLETAYVFFMYGRLYEQENGHPLSPLISLVKRHHLEEGGPDD